MEKNTTNIRYENEILAWEYDQRNSDLGEGELEWYLKYIRKVDGPVIEFACGSGRILIPIAEKGHKIEGIDKSKAMINRLKEKLEVYNSKFRKNVELYCDDMVTFDYKKKYELGFIGYNSIYYLRTKKKIKKFINIVFDLLTDNGYFLFMIRRQDLSRYKNNNKFIVDWLDEPIEDKKRNISIGTKSIKNLDKEKKRIIAESTYVIKKENNEKIIETTTYEPVISKNQFKKMLEKVGFKVNIYGGYKEKELKPEHKNICFVCRK